MRKEPRAEAAGLFRTDERTSSIFSLEGKTEGHSSRGALRAEARVAEDGFAALFDGPGPEGHLARCSALCADGVVHFARRVIALRLALVSARLAPLGGAEAPLCVELLLALGERELCVAVFALDLLIRHGRTGEGNKGSGDTFSQFLVKEP